jgi:DNA-binding MarR family transcriptional regulator
MASRARPLASSRRRSTRSREKEDNENVKWTFLTNHLHVLLFLYRRPDQRLRDIAVAVGITERMVQRIVVELVEAGYLKILKEGRRNHYIVNSRLRLRHPLEMHHTVGELIKILD